ncbi:MULTISPECIES: ABC transporter permease [Streptomyces]|uniref:ABC transporter permease n=1 Tax=Streptomyces albidoflavus TaxID=1886 RepID=A0A8G1ZSI2_9ACTN|nr:MULTISPECIES: ABC transporter permease [Streptomyces]MYX48133.1 ABC transporter permease [Streptomyces sp. SID8385]SCE15957.1 hypothetical protein GA0115236_137787 [Streptomyces sp. IgraMP-1]MCX4441654.1 ABC transporter permease [Streptomyces albidoflavus]RZE22401.1 ABC transporter permease [Streptomyces albidoflavus]RZE43410.1 ABC transporter permease [Streptomyces albidoflavus]
MASTPHENEPGSRHPDGGASVAPADEGDREVRGEGGGSGKGAAKKLLPVVLVLTGVLSAMLVVFGLPAVNGGPHHVPVGLVGPQAAAEALGKQLDQRQPDGWEVTSYPSTDALTQAIHDRDVMGGFAPDGQTLTVYTASAAGNPSSAAINGIGNAVAAQQGMEATTENVVPFPEDDPNGAGLTAAALPMIIGGVLPAVAMVRLFPGHGGLRLRLTGAVLFALAAGFALAAIIQFGFGSVDGTYWTTALGLSLGMAALTLPFLGLESLFGFVGLGAGIVVMMFVGNSLSGLATGAHWLPNGWATLGQLMPPGASGSLLRANGFFDGTGAGGPVAVLAAWAVIGLLLILLADRRGGRGTEEKQAEVATA